MRRQAMTRDEWTAARRGGTARKIVQGERTSLSERINSMPWPMVAASAAILLSVPTAIVIYAPPPPAVGLIDSYKAPTMGWNASMTTFRAEDVTASGDWMCSPASGEE